MFTKDTCLVHQKRKAHFLIVIDLVISLAIHEFETCFILHLDNAGGVY